MRRIVTGTITSALARARRAKPNRCAECGRPLPIRGFAVSNVRCRDCYGRRHYEMEGERVTEIESGAFLPGGAKLVEE